MQTRKTCGFSASVPGIYGENASRPEPRPAAGFPAEYGFCCHPLQIILHCRMYEEKLYVHSAGRREGLKIVHPCTIFSTSFERCSQHRLRTAFPTSCRNGKKVCFGERVRAGRPYGGRYVEFFAQAKILDAQECTGTYILEQDS